ncbi:15281_t:CDS:2, partial [Dentiscutata erythropus]
NGHSLYVFNDEQPHTVQVPYELTLNEEDLIYPSNAERWSIQPPLVRIYFKQLEQEALKKHSEMYPNYKYRPNKKKQDLNVLEESLTFVTSQSQIPTQSSE